MFAAFHLPFFGFTCLGFLAICVVLAIAIWIWVQSGDKGATKLNGGAGCAVGGALIFVAGLMALGCAVVLALAVAREAKNEFSEKLDKWQIETQGDHGLGSADEDADEHDESMDEDDASEHGADEHEHADAGGLRATKPADAGSRVEMHVRFHSSRAEELVNARRWLREHVDADLTTSHESSGIGYDSHDKLTETVDVAFELTEAEAARVEAAVREEWPDLKLPDGGTIELRRSPR